MVEEGDARSRYPAQGDHDLETGESRRWAAGRTLRYISGWLDWLRRQRSPCLLPGLSPGYQVESWQERTLSNLVTGKMLIQRLLIKVCIVQNLGAGSRGSCYHFLLRRWGEACSLDLMRQEHARDMGWCCCSRGKQLVHGNYVFLSILFIYLFLALHCCTGFSQVVASRDSSLAAACRLLMAVVAVVADHGPEGVWASAVAAPRI